MSDDQTSERSTFTPTQIPTESVRRFPVHLQLLVLAVVLIGLFALVTESPQALVAAIKNQQTPTPTEPAPLPLAQGMVMSGLSEVSDETRIGADAALVWDVANQRILYEKDPDTVLPLASLTKLMTTLVAYELVAEDTKVSIPDSATMQQSASGLQSGEVFTAARLSTLALLASSNDAAYSLASAIGSRLGTGEETTQFVAAMNIRAEELALPSLRFYNMTGLDLTPTEAGAYGSARDITKLMEYMVITYPELLSVTKDPAARVYNENGDFHDAENTNELVGRIPNLIGSKTGYTDLAGGNLIVAFDAGFNRPVIVTVLGSSRAGRFADVETLINSVLKANPEN